MKIDDSDLEALIHEHGDVSSAQVADRFGVSRQTAHKRLKAMVEGGLLLRSGAARATRYRLKQRVWDRRFQREGLAEDEVYVALRQALELLRFGTDSGNVTSYVVTEIVNNAIDHSGGQHVWVYGSLAAQRLTIEVRDDGVGIFAHVRKELSLSSELAAVQELSKGKTTTAPKQHTGEGLFFVSKVADQFRLQSGRTVWVVDNQRNDMTVLRLEAPTQGTTARMEVDLAHPRDLLALFNEYTEDYEFTKTRTTVKLFTIGVQFISRSEAKRLLHGLEKFQEVVLDFTGVEAVGQGFADQVFRVWAAEHPDIELQPIQMNEAVSFMVHRALRPRR